MSEVAEILKVVHDVFDGGELTVSVDERNLGMAYAIPRGLETTVIDTYGPWHDADVKQVFYRDSSIVRSVLAEIQMIISWRYSEASQYIVEAYFKNNVIALDPTVTMKIKIRFDQPRLCDRDLEAYEIPFNVEVDYRPIGTHSVTLYRGVIRADGTGAFEEL